METIGGAASDDDEDSMPLAPPPPPLHTRASRRWNFVCFDPILSAATSLVCKSEPEVNFYGVVTPFGLHHLPRVQVRAGGRFSRPFLPPPSHASASWRWILARFRCVQERALVFHEFHRQELFKPNSVDIVEINIGTIYHHCTSQILIGTSHARRSSGTHTGLCSPRQKYPSSIRGYINRAYSIGFDWSTPRNAKEWTTTSMGARRIDKDR